MKSTGITTFSLNGTPLLSKGNTMTLLARAPSLWAHVKVYAEGGENAIHAHPIEDHLFVILQGEATFMYPDGSETKAHKLDGVMVERGTMYAFRSSGDENLVMLRIGSPTEAIHGRPSERFPEAAEAAYVRIDEKGERVEGDDPRNKAGAVKGVVVEGKYFGA